MNFLDRWVVRIGDLLSLLFLCSVVISVLEVVLRYVFNAPTVWAHETTILFCAMCFIYGGSYCVAQDKHIRITVIYEALAKFSFGSKLQSVLDYISLVLCLIYVAAMAYGAYFVAKSSLFGPLGNWQPERSGSAWDPAIPAIVRSFLFVVLVIMVVQFILQLVLQFNSHTTQENTASENQDV